LFVVDEVLSAVSNTSPRRHGNVRERTALPLVILTSYAKMYTGIFGVEVADVHGLVEAGLDPVDGLVTDAMTPSAAQRLVGLGFSAGKPLRVQDLVTPLLRRWRRGTLCWATCDDSR